MALLEYIVACVRKREPIVWLNFGKTILSRRIINLMPMPTMTAFRNNQIEYVQLLSINNNEIMNIRIKIFFCILFVFDTI